MSTEEVASSAEFGVRPAIDSTPSPRSPISTSRGVTRTTIVGSIRKEVKVHLESVSLRKVYPSSAPSRKRTRAAGLPNVYPPASVKANDGWAFSWSPDDQVSNPMAAPRSTRCDDGWAAPTTPVWRLPLGLVVRCAGADPPAAVPSVITTSGLTAPGGGSVPDGVPFPPGLSEPKGPGGGSPLACS